MFKLITHPFAYLAFAVLISRYTLMRSLVLHRWAGITDVSTIDK